MQRQNVSATVKRKVIENLSERPSKIVCDSVSENHRELEVDVKETQRIISDLELRTKFGEDFVTLNNEKIYFENNFKYH